MTKPVANVMGNAKAVEKNNNDDPKGSRKLKNSNLPSPKVTAKKDPRGMVGKFAKVFQKSQRAFEAKYLKTGPLPAPEPNVWDESLEGFITHEGTKRLNLDHKFTSAPRLLNSTITAKAN